jgi:ATP-dependent helicase/nuclease subunit A
MQFSPEQQAAITAKNRELLVSAAAGSGKTAVLIEKIYTMLRDEGMSVDRMLVVTFTHAAAAEMRERLKQRMAGDAEPHLRRQRERLELAHISTLHIFCHRLVQEYFQAVDIDPLSAVADATMASNLFQEALDEAMERLYTQAAAGEAAEKALTDKFEDKQIVKMAAELYTFLMTLADPFGWLNALAERTYTLADLETGAMADTLLSDCKVLLDGARELADEMQALEAHLDCHEKYIPALARDREAVRALLDVIPKGLTALVNAARSFRLENMPSLRGLSDTEKEVNLYYKDLRDGVKKLAAKVGSQFRQEPDVLIAHLNRMQPALQGLARLCETLHGAYRERKKQRCLLDFSDLEHMALEILSRPEIRRDVAARFDAVFVDEYQDISGVQEAVLNAIKRPPVFEIVPRETIEQNTEGSQPVQAAQEARKPEEPGTERTVPYGMPPDSSQLTKQVGPDGQAEQQTKQVEPDGQAEQRFFYVGDVKQSIYRFRQADPTLFMEKEKTFSDDENAPQRRIDLNRNYRSRGAVIGAVNLVFGGIMRADVTEIDYDLRARLYPGQKTESDPPVQLHLFTQKLSAAERTRVQAAAIALEIAKRVGQPYFDRKENRIRTLRYRDIAVLAPRMKGVDEVLTRAMAARRIPAYAEGSGAGLKSDEIAQVLCHLRLMDNIRNDLSLLTCLRSPAIGMTDAELANIRIRTPKGSYLEALRRAAEGSDALSLRCAGALKELEHERFLLRNMPLPEYLWKWLSRSGLYAFYGCQPYGKLRQANLRLLCEKAVEFQARGGGDLKAFLNGVVSATAARESQSPTVLSPREDVVRVMSIHKSKGLEFPVVFLMGLETGFDHRKASELSLHQKLGVALPYVDEVLRVKGDTLLSSAIALRLESENLAERARVLYVGMTRARDELILTGCTEVPQFTPARPSAYAVASAGNMLDWLVSCADPAADICVLSESTFSAQSTSFPHKMGCFRLVSHNSAEETLNLLGLTQSGADLESLEKQRSRLDALAAEARAISVDLPAGLDAVSDPLLPGIRRDRRPFKVGVTALVRARQIQHSEAPELTDPETDDPADRETSRVKRLPLPLTRPRQMADLPRLPAFMRETAAGSQGIMRGVAAHKALCLLSYEQLRAQAGPRELRENICRQLIEFEQKRLFTGEEIRLIDPGSLAGFFESEWGRDALHAQTVKREWGFVLALPEEDGMLIQGVIDLCYLKDGQWVLLDYKTDGVKTAEELWPLYEAQTALYRRALSEITEIPVQSVTLYALALGEGSTRTLSQGQK